jgi:hypothetical protein
MTKTITAYEAPALIDAHSGLTRLSLYERLAGGSGDAPVAGLAAAISNEVVGYAAQVNQWTKPIGRSELFDIAGSSDVRGHARFWRTSDSAGDFVVTFIHVAAYLFASRWRRAGMPPEDYMIQAQWVMMAAGADRLAVVALADKTPEIFWVDADLEIQRTLRGGAEDMVRRLAAGDPPAVDAVAEAVPATAEASEAPSVEPEVAVARYRAARIARSETKNRVQFADHEFECAEKALLTVLSPGASLEYDGVRLTRNAKNDRISEETIDGCYF